MGNKKKAVAPVIPAKTEPLSEKEYQQALRKLHVELVKLQRWVVHKGLKVCIVSRVAMAPAKAAPSKR